MYTIKSVKEIMDFSAESAPAPKMHTVPVAVAVSDPSAWKLDPLEVYLVKRAEAFASQVNIPQKGPRFGAY